MEILGRRERTGWRNHKEAAWWVSRQETGVKGQGTDSYSVRRACMGSIPAARLAGTALAARATMIMPAMANR